MKHMKNKKIKINFKKFIPAVLILAAFFYIILFRISAFFNKDGISPDVTNTSNMNVQNDITINMSVIGDIMCHTTNFYDAHSKSDDSYDFSHVFKNITNYISDADIAIGNLETTFSGKSRGYTGYPTFNTPEQLGKNLKDLGLDVITTANNHSIDKGYSGIVSTLDFLDEFGLDHTGTARTQEEQDTILIKDINGIKIAFLTYTYGTNGITVPSDKSYCVNLIDTELIKKHIDSAKELGADIICTSMHWGDEYKLKQNTKQEELANFLFENGVDIILGSHPHVLEPMEKRTITLEDGSTKDCFVIYSLGNFMSGQYFENTKSTVILDIQITKYANEEVSIDSINYTPLYLNDKGSRASSRTRYELIDIRSAIENYDSGLDKSIGESLYKTLKTELTKIEKTVGQPIQ